jgi:hypothetical protein
LWRDNSQATSHHTTKDSNHSKKRSDLHCCLTNE